MKGIANFFSFAFHPLLLTTYLVYFLGVFAPSLLSIRPDALWLFTLFIFLITFVFPMLNVAFMLKWTGVQGSFKMEARKERIIPFLLISFIYAIVAGLFNYRHILDPSIDRIFIVIASLVVVGTAITFFFKISIHSLAAGGFVGILLALNKFTLGAFLYPVICSILIAGFVMSSRLWLNAHTLREVTTGALTGLITGVGGMIILFS